MYDVTKTGKDLIYLLACALHAEQPDARRIVNADFDALYRLAKAQSLGCMTASVLLGSGALPQEETPRWKELRDKAIRKNMLLDAERAQLTAYMEKEGIWYLPLKGVVLQSLYPAYGMRQMGDNDLLVDEKGLEKLERCMLARGYEKHGSSENHAAYIKAPVYNFEFHWSLMENNLFKDERTAYYADVQRLLLAGDTPFARKLSCEDSYVYITTHAYKHIKAGGNGLRAAVDQYVCLQAWQEMDRVYVQTELEKLGIAAFEKTLRELAGKLFASGGQEVPLAPDEEDLLHYMLGNGTYGTFDNGVKNRIERFACSRGEKGLRGRYLLWRLFPPVSQMKMQFPVLRRAVWLLPVMYCRRLLRGAFVRSGVVLRELRIVLKRK